MSIINDGLYATSIVKQNLLTEKTIEIEKLRHDLYNTTEQLRIEKYKNRNKLNIELPERYIINDGATILFWKDKRKTVVKRAKDDEFNPRLAYLTAFFQHYCGMSKNKANKYLASLEVENKKEDNISAIFKGKNKKRPKHMKEDK